jgi:hypothetical protein
VLGVIGVVPTEPQASTLTCTDATLVTLGQVQYTITPIYRR